MSQSWFEKKMEEKNRRPEFERNFFAVTIDNIPGLEITSIKYVSGVGWDELKNNCLKAKVDAVIGLREVSIVESLITGGVMTKIEYYGTGITYVRKQNSNESK